MNRKWILSIAGAACLLAAGAQAKTRAVFYFDTEDYTCDRSNDAIRDIANILKSEGVKGNFNVVGFLALRLVELGRHDVIEAHQPGCCPRNRNARDPKARMPSPSKRVHPRQQSQEKGTDVKKAESFARLFPRKAPFRPSGRMECPNRAQRRATKGSDRSKASGKCG